MSSKVYFIDMEPKKFGDNLFKKLNKLCEAIEFEKYFNNNDLTALKIHFGEKGNLAYIRPPLLAPIIEKLYKIGVKPFLTDANTLYRGTRSNAVDHSLTAFFNGFGFDSLKIPIVIADGLLGTDYENVEINCKHFNSVKISSAIYNSNSMVCISHVKGHEMAGFGGAIKNLSMGCASRAGKLQMHQDIKPRVSEGKCISCKQCAKVCPADAINFPDKARIDPNKCIGCGDCTVICPTEAIKILWGSADNESTNKLQEKMAEYAKGAVKGKENRSVYFNFITNVSPQCDCFGFNGIPIVNDIGIMCSTDPVAIDLASVDMINKAVGNPNSELKNKIEAGTDKFKVITPDINWRTQIEYSEKIGLGSTDYEVVEL